MHGGGVARVTLFLAAIASGSVAEAKPLVIEGDVVLPAVVVDDREQPLPTIGLSLAAAAEIQQQDRERREGADLIAVPAEGWGQLSPAWKTAWYAPKNVRPLSWEFAVVRVHEDGERRMVWRHRGDGAVPGQISWNGLDANGKPARSGYLYAARLVVKGSKRRVMVASAWSLFGIDYKTLPSRTMFWREDLFAGKGKKLAATPKLKDLVAELTDGIGSTERVLVEVHWGGSGDALAAIAQTQKEADLIAGLLRDAGISDDQMEARGRGALEPLVSEDVEGAAERNRRVAVTVRAAERQKALVPRYLAADAQVLVEREQVEIDPQGQFRIERADGAGRSLMVDVRCADGRRVAIDLGSGPSARRSTRRGANRSERTGGRNGAKEARGDTHLRRRTR